MNEKKLLKRIEKLRDKALRLEAEAKVYYEQAEVLRNDGNESLLDLADKFEDKADELNLRADELEDELDDLRYNAKVDDTPKIKTVSKRKVEMETWDDTSQRLKKVFENYLEMAQQGNIIAIYEVGNCFYNGLGVEKNIAEALKWYKLAAEGGHVEAGNQINEMFLRGESPEMFLVKPSPTKKISTSFFKPNKKSSTSKKSYDGNFGDVDARLSALYNSEKFGYEDSSNDDDDD